ncbi:MAG TPA: hypothetical protein VIJ01_17365 [Candidatus Angelobacter sp.]|jgi:hypothetical protein
MKRPGLVTIVAVAETLAGAALVSVTVFAFLISREDGKARGLDPLAITALGALAGLAVISSFGLWKGEAWGWAFALLTCLTGLVIFLWDPIERRVWPHVDDLSFIVGFAVLVILLLLAPVRRFFLPSKEEAN